MGDWHEGGHRDPRMTSNHAGGRICVSVERRWSGSIGSGPIADEGIVVILVQSIAEHRQDAGLSCSALTTLKA